MPQIGGMYEGDRSRKQTLVDFGFRLPSALDNRPLRFDEFLAKVPQLVMVSATPGAWELRHSTRVAEQLIRPTGIVDPEVELRPTRNQIDDLLNEIRRREEKGERTLVTTLTKKMSEDLTDYLLEAGVKARYLHSEIDTLERIQIIRDLRLGEYDVLVGVNLLREGLDLPEVSLVAILDADKEGFLRGQTALIQTIGRAARNINGQRADVRRQAHRGDQVRARRDRPPPRRSSSPTTRSTGSRPRRSQGRLRHRRVPLARRAARAALGRRRGKQVEGMDRGELEKLVITLEEEMFTAAEELRFEYAAKLRDEIKELRRELAAFRPRSPHECARFVIAILLSGFVTGGLARLALPGPDPMPLWLTIAIGLAGSIAGAVIGDAVSNGNGYVVSFLSLGVAIALVAAYRHFVQRRPILGPGAMQFPERGIGVEQYRSRLSKVGIDPDARAPDPKKLNQLRLLAMLEELHKAGVLDDEELAAKRAAVETGGSAAE